ncbi:FAD-dependent oxidoreductase [Achromobacter marplatensis]|uniref:3-(3-hydroxy-phenyl)propionate hydroxylase n=1 Tax=Achromobacter marplatensis TaxID=470868 RepID=A0ABX9GH18_9BURK|nr:FAD-dependent monooxygenase [Achromobacter marplatensis]OWT70750.1 FAD-dependent oxidoreductase [Achromobacter marplatensis]RBP22351.1 3-(3-hydroxy-phenyl)propionate hydroxylase [Achromobacter marplatensis]CAB3657787.1 3-(3-hydroxy-phenyl)propionate/3-hydroxycinnamic acid hydroxylase [Achromobacter marplatensis]
MPLPSQVPVLIAGGGPVGLTLAALLAEYGIASLTVEADDDYCAGSRAICISRRSQEILSWAGADQPLMATGLPWTGGRSYFRDREVLHFEMPHDPLQRYAPMVNIQQYSIEEYAHQAMQRHPGQAALQWSARVAGLQADADGVTVEVDAGGQRQTVRADWLIACDGGRSTVREAMGLKLEGMQYEGRYVIVDIEQASSRPVERLAWFDPPSNPGSTLLMHRQPGNVWRVDYQIRDDEDPDEAVKPENVLPRVQSHLDMIGETAPWKPLWISIYNAKCLTLDQYRHGRVLFAGDAGHLVPIFGVRGLNSGLDDAGNLAWKLAWVLKGQAPAKLLDSYSVERVHATRQNLAYGAKSTEFMAPPDFGFRLMREAALRLALVDDNVRSLINPRQSAPISYDTSPLNLADGAPQTGPAAAPGQPAPDALLQDGDAPRYLSECFGRGFVALAVSPATPLSAELDALAAATQGLPQPLQVVSVGAGGWHDAHDQLRQRYGAADGMVYLLRPDGYVLGRWTAPDAATLRTALIPYYPSIALPAKKEAQA